jgi:alkyl hydroperoxide reductase subunit D
MRCGSKSQGVVYGADMQQIDLLATQLELLTPDLAQDLTAVLDENTLAPPLRYAVALACCLTLRDTLAARTLHAICLQNGWNSYISDARSAAALMAMNNVFYRFKHMINEPIYHRAHPRLKAHALHRPQTSRAEMEVLSLAVSALHGCEDCVRLHEKKSRDYGVTHEQIIDTIRIAATMQGVCVALGFDGNL